MPYALITLLAFILLLFNPVRSSVAETTPYVKDVHQEFYVWSIPDPYTALHGDFLRWSTAAASTQLKSEFWTWYLQVMPPKDVKVQATRRGVGENVYVFVRDEDWQNPVTQKDVNNLINAFERATPANPNKGIYQIVTETFGLPPDKDGDPKMYVLILELGEFTGHYFNGLFRFIDQTDKEHSNKLDIIYIDSNITSHGCYLGVLSHELQHLIHWQYDQEEDNWVNETLSEVCTILCGYYIDEKQVVNYLKNPDKALVTKAHGGVSYGACILWGTYLYDRLGKEFLRAWVMEKSHGIDGFNAALRTLARKGGFIDYFSDWMAALYLNDPRIGGGCHHLHSIELPTAPSAETITSYPINIERTVNGFGIDYLRFNLHTPNIRELGLTLSSDDSELLVKVIKISKKNPLLTKTEDVQSKVATLTIDNRKSLYNEVVLAVTVPKITDEPVKYRITAYGMPLDDIVKTAISAGD